MDIISSFSSGTIYHNVFTWGEYQTFSFTKGYNPRLIVKLQKNSLKNQRTIGIRLQADYLHGWAFTTPQNASNGLELRPVIFNQEKDPITVFEKEKIINNVPVHGIPPLDPTEFVIKSYVDNSISTTEQNITNIENTITNIENTIDQIQHQPSPLSAFIPPQRIRSITVGDDIRVEGISCNPVNGWWLVAGRDTTSSDTNRKLFYYSKDDGEHWTKRPSLSFSTGACRIVPTRYGQWAILYGDTNTMVIEDIDSGWVTDLTNREYHGLNSANAVYDPIRKNIYYSTGQKIGYSFNGGHDWFYLDNPTSYVSTVVNILCCCPFTGTTLILPYKNTGQTSISYIPPYELTVKIRSCSIPSTNNYLANLISTINDTFWFNYYNDGKLYHFFTPHGVIEASNIKPGSKGVVFPHYYSNTLIFITENSEMGYYNINNNPMQFSYTDNNVYAYVRTTYGSTDVIDLGFSWAQSLLGENVLYSCNIKTGTTMFTARNSNKVYKLV